VFSGHQRGSTEECLISAGEMIGLDRNVSHSVEALEESAIVLIAAID
jgi:quercetin dioxygenase-like cupin family protein